MLNKELAVKICRKCSGEMKEGIALQNGISYGLPDFVGDDLSKMSEKELRGQTFSYSGQAAQVVVWKCSECGHSFTK